MRRGFTPDGEEQQNDRFKTLIDDYVKRIKKHFPKRGTQKHGNGNEYKLTFSNEHGYNATIKNDLEQGNQFILDITKEYL